MAENGLKGETYSYQKGDAALIPALAMGKATREAAELSGLGERTITRRLSDPAFRREVRRVQGEMVDAATAALSEGATEAAKKLKDLLAAKSEQVQLGAARALLDFNLRLREQSEIQHLKEEVESLKALIKAMGEK